MPDKKRRKYICGIKYYVSLQLNILIERVFSKSIEHALLFLYTVLNVSI